MNNKLTFNKQEDLLEYDQFVSSSLQGTIFSESFFLKLLKKKYHLWNVKQGTELKAAVCLIVSDDENKVIVDDRVIYSGIMFSVENQRLKTKKRSDEFEITKFIIENLIKKYKKINFQVSPEFSDLRPFQWFNYFKKTKKKFSLFTRYTSYIDFSKDNLSNFLSSKLYLNMETVRRYDYRKACKEKASIVASSDISNFLDFYRKLMKKQKINVPAKEIKLVNLMISQLIDLKRCKLFYVKDKSENILYALVYIWDNKRAYYFLGAGNPKKNTPWQSTFGHCEVFRYLQKHQSINLVDLEGVNSPQRGWFKLSLGGSLTTYYNVVI